MLKLLKKIKIKEEAWKSYADFQYTAASDYKGNCIGVGKPCTTVAQGASALTVDGRLDGSNPRANSPFPAKTVLQLCWNGSSSEFFTEFHETSKTGRHKFWGAKLHNYPPLFYLHLPYLLFPCDINFDIPGPLCMLPYEFEAAARTLLSDMSASCWPATSSCRWWIGSLGAILFWFVFSFPNFETR